MGNNINDIIANCLDAFNKDYPGVVQAALKEQFFMTAVQDITEVPRNSGIIEARVKNLYIIDFTQKMMYDEDDFARHSQKLYNLFGRIEKWYEV